MKYIAIIATRDFGAYWQTASNEYLELKDETSNKNLLIWRKDDELSFSDYKDKIVTQLNNARDIELGVIFHKLAGEAEAALLRDGLTASFNVKLAFCEWYSSNKTDFWNESKQDDNKPYNNLKRAWKDGHGSKEKTFEAVWNLFTHQRRNGVNIDEALSLLHDIYAGESIREILITEIYKNEVEAFFLKIKSDVFNANNSDHKLALADLRNNLLKNII